MTVNLVKPHGSVAPAFTVTLGATVRVSGGPAVPSPRVAVTVPPTVGTKVALKAPLSSVTGLATVTPSTATVTVWPAVAGVTVPCAVTVWPYTTAAGATVQAMVGAGWACRRAGSRDARRRLRGRRGGRGRARRRACVPAAHAMPATDAQTISARSARAVAQRRGLPSLCRLRACLTPPAWMTVLV